MVTTAPNLESVENVLSIISDNDMEHYNLEEEEIRKGHICECDYPSRERGFYKMDKTEIVVCGNCGGYYGKVMNNWV